jgi:hypothetical protein
VKNTEDRAKKNEEGKSSRERRAVKERKGKTTKNRKKSRIRGIVNRERNIYIEGEEEGNQQG